MAYGTLERVKRYLSRFGRQIGSRVESLITETDVNDYLSDADQWLDSELVEYYEMPLQTVVRTVDATPTSIYPYPIEQIVSRKVVLMLLGDIFSEVDPNAESIAVQRFQAETDNLLNKVKLGDIRLVGNHRKSPTHFVNPYLLPRVMQGPTPPVV